MIAAFGSEEQKRKYLPDLCSGRKIGAFGLTEPNAGSDAGGTETTAEDMGDYYLLNGEKIFITNGGEADTYVVFAVTTPGIGTRGISALIVEKGWEGFTFEPHYDKLGIRSSATCQLNFNDVKVPKENLLGKEGMGFKIAMSTLDGGRIGIAAQALGIAQGAYEAAVSTPRRESSSEGPSAHSSPSPSRSPTWRPNCAAPGSWSTPRQNSSRPTLPTAWKRPWPRCTLPTSPWK